MYYTATYPSSLLGSITRAAQKKIKQQTGMRVTLVLCNPEQQDKTPDVMLEVIAAALNMSPACYKAQSRTRNISELRFVATIFLRKHFPAVTLKQIGELFGGKDHSSVIYCYARAKVLLAIKDPSFTKKYVMALKSVNQWLAK